MVAARRLLFPLELSLICLSAASAQTLPDYKIGDIATQEVATPFSLTVIDPEATKALREKESLRVPVIFRFYPQIATDAEAALLSALDRKRYEFLDKIESVFDRRMLQPQMFVLPSFQRLLGSFIQQNKNFPFTTNLLELWAQNEPDEWFRSSLKARLREAAKSYIRPDVLPNNIKLGGTQVRLFTNTGIAGKFTLDSVERSSLVTLRTNVPPLNKARADLVKSFPIEERSAGRFLASFLPENCEVEVDLTLEARKKKTDSICSIDHYEPGQLILKREQIVDARAKAALEQLGVKMEIGRLQQQIAEAQSQAGRFSQRSRSLLAALIALIALSIASLIGILRLAKRKRTAGLLPVLASQGKPGDLLIACPSCSENVVIPLAAIRELALPSADESSATAWQQRALAAEARAKTATAAARNGLISHLARLLKEKFVAKLLTQRTELLGTHEKAAAEVAGLEARLRQINAPLQERLMAYQNRIAELEKELAAKSEENRELIKVKIQLTKNQLEAAREQNPMGLN